MKPVDQYEGAESFKMLFFKCFFQIWEQTSEVMDEVHLQCLLMGCLKSSWTRLINPSRNFVEVRWRSLFQNTSLGERCTSYNAPPTSRKRAADRWSLRNFLPRSSFFMVAKPRNRMRWDLDCMAVVLIGFHRSRWAHPLPLFNRATLTLH
jgi:hypothetical protein